MEMTRDQFIERALGLMSVMADFVPTHTEEGLRILRSVQSLQNARFTDER
jgi:hypothetical protein